ncbi:gamma-glutamyl-gamma-aminobutyrate hydrolase family protein [Pseudomonas sp. X10]
MIGASARTRQIGLHAVRTRGDKHGQAVAAAAKALPLSLPPLAALLDPAEIIDGPDRLLFTGSSSDTEPLQYSGLIRVSGTAHDPGQDGSALPRHFCLGGHWHPECQMLSQSDGQALLQPLAGAQGWTEQRAATAAHSA